MNISTKTLCWDQIVICRYGFEDGVVDSRPWPEPRRFGGCSTSFESMDNAYYSTLCHDMETCSIWSGVGVSKPIFAVPLFSQFFRMIKTLFTCMISRSYLTGVTAAELRRHLTNMNVIEHILAILLLILTWLLLAASQPEPMFEHSC